MCSAPEDNCASSKFASAAATPKLQLAYHLLAAHDQLKMSLLDAQMARPELHLCARLRDAWTDVGGVGVVRRARLGKIDGYSQTLYHLGVDPPDCERERRLVWRARAGAVRC